MEKQYDEGFKCTMCGKAKWLGKFPSPCKSGARRCIYEPVATAGNEFEALCGSATQDGQIIRHMYKRPTEWFIVADFCNGAPFIGYKAAARLGEMKKEGTLIGRWSERRTYSGRRYKEYRLNHEVYEFKTLGHYIMRAEREKLLTETQILKYFRHER